MNDLKPYDWAQDDRPQKYLCDQGHTCYLSSKPGYEHWVFCPKHDQGDKSYLNMNGNMSIGMYIPSYMCKEVHETQWKSASKVEIIVGEKSGQGGPYPVIKHDDEIEMFAEKEFNELKKKLNI